MSIRLDESELQEITGYTRAPEQLNELHRLGFVRARIDRLNRVVVERAHYEAVCEGRYARQAQAQDQDEWTVPQVRS